jgi:hypothetical protein
MIIPSQRLIVIRLGDSVDIRGVARPVKEVTAATQGRSFRDGPKDQTRNLEIPGSLRAPE